MGAIYQHLSEGGTTLKIRPRLVSNGTTTLFDEIQVTLTAPPVGPGDGALYNGYGALYNGYAAIDSRNIAANGWNVSTSTDWIALRTYLGGSLVSGGKIKEVGFEHWHPDNTGATDDVGFSARAAGIRYSSNGNFEEFKYTNTLYCSDLDGTNSYAVNLFANDNALYLVSVDSKFGGSIRTVRSATEFELILPDGIISAIYTGNDGKVYPCTKVGTQVWVAMNLNETKYRNGDWIHGFDGGVYTLISNAAWTALTTEAMCYYTH